ncbi:histidine phosphatase family protein [Corynebacterium freiburgense]|uniref:histidine phosphatase family protein n=1 Tax=Corynebacterium freiburgense TaxID=556548 RepID=UPI0003FF1265|nr:histidine phosphatase family protein [Corynebacterium freiburgense]WJZ03878.1 Phosphoserine phosphatase 1 [Corynebacterium freiburgense]
MLILVRHGQTHSNVAKIIDTRPPGAELTELGRTQASDLGLELAQYDLSSINCSVALRAQQTALLLAASYHGATGKQIPVDIQMGVHEIYAGQLDGRDDRETADSYTKAFKGWLEGDIGSRLPGGENHVDVLQRAQPVLETLAARDGINLLVSHGAAIRTMARWATGVPAEFAFENYLPNGRTVILDPGGRPFGEWNVVSWG